MDLRATLLASERGLTEGNGDVYRDRLIDEAVVIVPGQVLDKAQTAEAIDAADGWDRVELDDAELVELTDDVAVLTYRFTGQRGQGPTYRALMASVYVRRANRWQLALHQQTPLA